MLSINNLHKDMEHIKVKILQNSTFIFENRKCHMQIKATSQGYSEDQMK